MRALVRQDRSGDQGFTDVTTAREAPLDMGNPVPRREAAARLAALRDRTVEIFAMFSGGQRDRYNCRGQYGDAFSRSRLRDLIDEYYVAEALADTVIGRHRRRLGSRCRRITLDFDPTDDPTHGQQEFTFFRGYCDTPCYLPLVGTLGFNGEADCERPHRVVGRDGPGERPERRRW